MTTQIRRWGKGDHGPSFLLRVAAILVVVCLDGVRDARAAAARDPRRPDDAVRRRSKARSGAASRPRQPRRVDGRHGRLGRRLRVQLTPARAGFAAALARRPRLGGGRRARRSASSIRRTSVFYEAPTRTHMFVYTPSGDVQVSPWSVARRARRLGGGRRVGRERRDQGRPGVRGDPRGRRHHDGERARLPQPRRAARRPFKGRRRRSPRDTRTPPSTTTGRTRFTSIRAPTFCSTTRSSSSRTRATSTASAIASSRRARRAPRAGSRSRTRPAASPTTRRARRSRSTSTPTRRAGRSPGRRSWRRSSRTPAQLLDGFQARSRTAASSSATDSRRRSTTRPTARARPSRRASPGTCARSARPSG